MKHTLYILVAIAAWCLNVAAQPQVDYARSVLSKEAGLERYKIAISVANDSSLPAEGFTLSRKGRKVSIAANDPSGAIYGANRLVEIYRQSGSLDNLTTITDAPEMKLRGTCVGLQKVEYLPGHKVYEYPYTPENFPWFYDKALWLRYLDLLAANNMNALYLWNGHPFASLVKLADYPFAAEVDDQTMALNQEMFSFLTTEAQRRGICVIQMFYNIIVSKPFADHYGIATQDRNRPITPLISDYTRKSIAAFIEQYPNVGFLVCLGEAMATIDDDVQWMTETIIPGIKDGLAASGRTDIPPIILRSHDTDGPLVLEKSLPLYPNIYTMTKYTGESLTTYEPGGPWGETQRQLSSVAPIHISNVHILANLEPWRWASPLFVEKTVQAMHRVHGANGLHLYPQASYWDWPYTADSIAHGRQLQLDRDWLWYAAWGRYAWQADRGNDSDYWTHVLASYYATALATARRILQAYAESGEIAPKLIRRFGITEGNRQTLLLGMKISQLVNPYKYTVYPGFYESCGPQGEKLIEYVERDWRGEAHVGELPLDIVNECVAHGDKAVAALEGLESAIGQNVEEFRRLQNDMLCYQAYAYAFKYKVLAAEQVLRYKWWKDTDYLLKALPLLEQSGSYYQQLIDLTLPTYLYANSMQTSLRRIPVGGDDGKYKHWAEMQQVYDDELDALKHHIQQLTSADSDSEVGVVNPLAESALILSRDGQATASNTATNGQSAKQQAAANGERPTVRLISDYKTVAMAPGVKLFEGRDEAIDSLAAELVGLEALILNRDTTRICGATVEVETDKDVTMLVGFFIDDQTKFASPPKLETDATGNDYGQAEALLTNAISMSGMPMVNIHPYRLTAGRHLLRLPKGIIMVAGFTDTPLKPRDAKLGGSGGEVDWLFMK